MATRDGEQTEQTGVDVVNVLDLEALVYQRWLCLNVSF